MTDLTADSWSATLTEATELAETRKRKLADTGELKSAADTKDRSDQHSL